MNVAFFSSSSFFEKKSIVVVRDVCPPVACGNNLFSRNLISNRPIEIHATYDVLQVNLCARFLIDLPTRFS